MLLAVRVRGSTRTRGEIRTALDSLRLDRVNHAVLLPDEKRHVLDLLGAYITYGEIRRETLAKMLAKRARLEGDRKIDDEFMKKNKAKGIDELADAIISGGKKTAELGIKPVFRLRPPKKGYGSSIKKDFKVGGGLGYRGDAINKLAESMI